MTDFQDCGETAQLLEYKKYCFLQCFCYVKTLYFFMFCINFPSVLQQHSAYDLVRFRHKYQLAMM